MNLKTMSAFCALVGTIAAAILFFTPSKDFAAHVAAATKALAAVEVKVDCIQLRSQYLQAREICNEAAAALKRNPDDEKAQKDQAEWCDEKEIIKEQLKGCGK